MKAILSHSSALEFLRSTDASRLLRPQPTRSLAMGDYIPDERVLQIQHAYSLSLPVHLLVSRDEKRPHTNNVVYHTRSAPLPHGSLLYVENGLFVTSPEFCFVQLPSVEDLLNHIFIGYELCGTYRSGERYNQDPLTSLSKLTTYAQRSSGAHGIVQTRRVLRYVLPDSASSMETALSMLLSLPSLLGGCCLSAPQLNARIDPGQCARPMMSQEFFKCDLYWEKAKLAVEYDSNLYHTGPQRIAKDSKRRDELSALGVTVITVTAGQVYDLATFNKVARTIAKHLGERLPTCDRRFVERQHTLRCLLLGITDRQIG